MLLTLRADYSKFRVLYAVFTECWEIGIFFSLISTVMGTSAGDLVVWLLVIVVKLCSFVLTGMFFESILAFCTCSLSLHHFLLFFISFSVIFHTCGAHK